MALAGKGQQISFFISQCRLFAQNISCSTNLLRCSPQTILCRAFSLSLTRPDLMEFFDVPKNWGVKEVRSGRSWTKDELRIKSNFDLHKLWYVLYKEKNMLLTMSEECDRICQLFPNPERIYKVEESMENLETVVAERNKAAKLLELGITGEAPQMTCYGGLGLRYVHKYTEHIMPYWHNAKHFPRRYVDDMKSESQRKFLHEYWAMNRRKVKKQRRFEVAKLHEAQRMYPESEVWQKKDPKDLTWEEVYHQKMSE